MWPRPDTSQQTNAVSYPIDSQPPEALAAGLAGLAPLLRGPEPSCAGRGPLNPTVMSERHNGVT